MSETQAQGIRTVFFRTSNRTRWRGAGRFVPDVRAAGNHRIEPTAADSSDGVVYFSVPDLYPQPSAHAERMTPGVREVSTTIFRSRSCRPAPP